MWNFKPIFLFVESEPEITVHFHRNDRAALSKKSFCLEGKSSIKVRKKALIRGIGPGKTLGGS